MKNLYGSIAVAIICASLHGCASTPTLVAESKLTFELTQAGQEVGTLVKVVDLRSSLDRQEKVVDQHLHLGDHRFSTSPEAAVAAFLSKLVADPELPEARRRQIQNSTVRITFFEVRLMRRDYLSGRPSSGFPGIDAVDYLMRSLTNAATGASQFDVHLVLEIDDQIISAGQGAKLDGGPASNHLSDIFNGAMKNIRRQLINRSFDASAK